MRSNQYYENLIKRVIELSESNIWERAVLEWEIFDCEIDDTMTESCVCGKEHLRYLFTIRNAKNGFQKIKFKLQSLEKIMQNYNQR